MVNHWTDNAGFVNMNSNKQLNLKTKLFSETPHLVSNNTLIYGFLSVISGFNNQILCSIFRKKNIIGITKSFGQKKF